MFSFMVSPFFPSCLQFLVCFLILLNKLVSLYESFSSTATGIFFSVVEVSFSLMGVVSLVCLFLRMINCSHWLKLKIIIMQ